MMRTVAPSLVNQSASTRPVGPAPIIRTSLRVTVSSRRFGYRAAWGDPQEPCVKGLDFLDFDHRDDDGVHRCERGSRFRVKTVPLDGFLLGPHPRRPGSATGAKAKF